MRKLFFAVLACLFSPLIFADTVALHAQAFNQQLEEFAKDNAIDRYEVAGLSDAEIHIILWYTPGEHFSNEELSAHTDGVCFGMLKQAIQAGARPFTNPMIIRCEARQASSAAPLARGRELGQSRYNRHNDTFVYTSASSSLK